MCPANRLAAVRARIEAAARAAGRDPAGIRLVAVSKLHAPEDVRALAAEGIRDFGESRAQELVAKAAALHDPDLRWHFVGRLQRNKAKAVAGVASYVHSLDRAVLVAPLAAGAAGREPLPVLVQVSLDGDPDRGGVPAGGVAALAALVAGEPALRLAGLMAVAVPGRPARPQFARLRELSEALTAAHPDATEISAGMSGDLEDAVREGATLVRVGTALFGPRSEH